MDRLKYTRVQDVDSLTITTAGMAGYARRVLTDAQSMLSVLQRGAGLVAHGFRNGAHQKANSDLFNLLDAVHCLLVCLYHVQNACDLEEGPLDSSLIARMTSSLDAIQSSQERMDWPALARQLEGQFVPVLREFDTVLETMKNGL
ncbi:hypothetical protein ES703_118693 [subsurface metagenome]